MSGQFNTESGGTVGIYRKKDRYNLIAKEGDEVTPTAIELTEDELYRLIYIASKDMRWLVNIVDSLSNGWEIPVDLIDLMIERRQRIPTEDEITKRRRSAQRTKRQ